MIMRIKYRYILFLIAVFQGAFAQDFTMKNQNKVMGTINPSFYGFGDSSKAGIIYSTEGYNEGSKIENRFGFANHYFENSEFSLALDVNSTKITQLGFSTTQANLHYIYKAQLSYEWTFNPSISVGYGNSRLDYSSLVFEDQINVLTGYIAGVSRDPVNIDNKINYLDIGAGAVVHNNQNMFFGFNLKHINNPETSFNSNASNKKDMFMSFQSGYEKDLNPYGQSTFLPENSYLYLFNSFSKQGAKTRFDLYQEAILGNISFGINEHFNKYDGFSVSQMGTSLSIFIEEIEVGANYSFDIGSKKVGGTTYNTFELYVTFDFNPFKKNRRGNNSRFYDMQ
jgi:type IX secretion system PorP/SprF family membrane protein